MHTRRTNRRYVVAFVLLLLLPAVAETQPIIPDPDDVPEASRSIAIEGARLVIRPGEVLERGTILMRDGLIVRVGKSVNIPLGTRRIDGDGMTVYAGFIDGGSVAGVLDERIEEEENPERAGDPPPVRAGLQPERDVRDLFDRTASAVDSLRRAGFGLVHLMPRHGFLAGQGALVLLGARDTARWVWRPGASLVASFEGADNVYPATPMGIIASLRNLFRQAVLLRDHRRAFERSPAGLSRPNDDEIRTALLPTIAQDRPLYFNVEDDLEVRRALALGDELDLPVIIGGLRHGHDVLDELAQRKTPTFLSLDFPDAVDRRKKNRRRGNNADTLVEEDLPDGDSTTRPVPVALETFNTTAGRTEDHTGVPGEYLRLVAVRNEARRAALLLPRKSAESDIAFGFSTADVPSSKVRDKVREAVTAGLSEQDALAALTTHPARLLGVDRSFGTLESGKVANLVVTRGSWFADSGTVAMTLVDGLLYDYRHESDDGDWGEESKDDDTDAAWKKQERGGNDDIARLFPTNGADPVMPGRAVAARRNHDGTILVRGGTLLTVAGATPLADTDILIENGRIAKIGRGLSAPSGAEVIDAEGMHVMPGIIDAHSHIAVSGPVNEWTSPVTAEVKIGDVIDPFDITIYRALAGGVTTSHVMHGSANPIGGECETIKHRYGEVDPERIKMEGAPRTIKFALGENPTRVHGRGFNVPPSTRMGVEQVFRKSFTDARRYMREWDVYRSTLQSDRERLVPPVYSERLETLAAILRGEVLVHCHSYRADEIVMLLGVLKDFGVSKITFQHANEGFKVAPELAEFGASASVFSDWWAYKFEVYYSTAYNAAILTRNNVVTSINSDSPELNRHLYHEAAKSMRYGSLSEIEALRLITINPAKQLGIDERVGTLEIGKEGDLAIFEGHPLSIYTRPRMTIVDGVIRFDAKTDPDDMRLRVDAEASISEVADEHQHHCMEGVEGGAHHE